MHALVAAIILPFLLISYEQQRQTALQPLALRLLHNCLYSGCGLESALGHSAVETCIELLAVLTQKLP